jgi:glycosyltransferase involved in cell wall biosynthesis
VKTGPTRPSVVQVNYAFDKQLTDPDALLDRYATLTGWAGAVRAAGARESVVVQRFHTSARRVRGGIDYYFVDRGVSRVVAGLAPDVAHVNGLVFPIRTWMLRRALPRASSIVVQNHSDTGPLGAAPLLRAAGRATRGAVDAFLFAADEHALRWKRAGFIPSSSKTYQVMEASTTFEPVARDGARAATRVNGAPALLWVGRLNTNKDPQTILQGFESAAGQLPDATLTMIFHTDDLAGAVRARVDASPLLRERVRLAGAVPHGEMPRYFSAADIFILGSHHEGSGYSLMEALACGATPAVTDIPTFRLLTGGGSVGALWPPGDAAACARAIADVSGSVSAANRARVREHFAQRFSWRAVGERAMDVYEHVIARRSA